MKKINDGTIESILQAYNSLFFYSKDLKKLAKQYSKAQLDIWELQNMFHDLNLEFKRNNTGNMKIILESINEKLKNI